MSPEQANKRFDTLMAKADVALVEQVAGQIKNGMGALLDLGLRGRGCIARRFQADSSLQEALANEMAFVADLVNNKTRIALCIGSDTIAGFQDARKERENEKEKEKEKEPAQAQPTPAQAPDVALPRATARCEAVATPCPPHPGPN